MHLPSKSAKACTILMVPTRILKRSGADYSLWSSQCRDGAHRHHSARSDRNMHEGRHPPSWRTLRLIQDKYEQKACLGDQGVPIAEQMIIEASGDAMYASLHDVSVKFPWMLKARKDSYDGRGTSKISKPI
jgi:hypothetical protein